MKVFDDRLCALAARMFELMRESKGVGLAAPQVGENIRLFIINPTGEAGDDRVYVNPTLSEPAGGEEEGEEGCLSLPEINAKIMRDKTMRIDAQNLEGKGFTDTQSGYIPASGSMSSTTSTARSSSTVWVPGEAGGEEEVEGAGGGICGEEGEEVTEWGVTV